MNVVIVGHVDHGKSTLIGRLLYDSESITEGRLTEIQKLAEEYKKRFEFAYFLDSFEDELREERTIDTTGVMFKGKRNYSIIDVPGHKEFIRNMLTGASRAEVAVLVISAREGIEEQTRRHAFLVHLLGLRKILVVVNKMDVVNYDPVRFETIRGQALALLGAMGFSDLKFIPASALEGDNIYRRSARMPWYEGPTLIEALDSVEIGKEEKPLRFVVQDTYEVDSEKVVVGRVESGVMKKGDIVLFQPSGVRAEIRRIRIFGAELERAESGDSIGIVVDEEVRRGDVCGLAVAPPAATRRLLGQAVVVEGGLRKGDELELRCGARRVACKVEEIAQKINSETGEVIETRPLEIGEGEAGTILFSTEPIVVEKFRDIPELGRFVLSRGRNIGAGVVLEVLS